MHQEPAHTALVHFASFQRGEEAGFTYFFNQHHAALVYFAHRLVEDTQAAEDIVEDCFVALWERRANIQKPGSIKSYLYTAVKNSCLDYLNRQKREKLAALEAAYITDEATNPLAVEVLKAELTSSLFAALTKLPKAKARIFQMFYVEEKSLKEIAAELKISTNTVRNQKVRAVESLRKGVLGMKR